MSCISKEVTTAVLSDFPRNGEDAISFYANLGNFEMKGKLEMPGSATYSSMVHDNLKSFQIGLFLVLNTP